MQCKNCKKEVEPKPVQDPNVDFDCIIYVCPHCNSSLYPEFVRIDSRFNLTRDEYDKLVRISDQKNMGIGEVIEAMIMAGIKHTKIIE